MPLHCRQCGSNLDRGWANIIDVLWLLNELRAIGLISKYVRSRIQTDDRPKAGFVCVIRIIETKFWFHTLIKPIPRSSYKYIFIFALQYSGGRTLHDCIVRNFDLLVLLDGGR